MDTRKIISENKDEPERPKGQKERLEEQGRREDGTKADLDKDSAPDRDREDNDDDVPATGQRGTGIPGFGV